MVFFGIIPCNNSLTLLIVSGNSVIYDRKDLECWHQSASLIGSQFHMVQIYGDLCRRDSALYIILKLTA